MIEIIISGGSGDLAQNFKNEYSDKYKIYTPGREIFDVTNEDSIIEYIHDKDIDVLINNAGSIHPKRIIESDSNLWINDINVNLIGTYLCTKHVLIKNKDAIIINISSSAGFMHYPDWSSYCSAKSAVITFTKCLSSDNYNAYCLCPGAIDTKFRDGLNIINNNMMSTSYVSNKINEVISNKYKAGDILFFRKNEFILNPDKDL